VSLVTSDHPEKAVLDAAIAFQDYLRSRAAMVSIQYDEYGGDIAAAMHAELFATTMLALDLDPAYGAYLGALPGPTLATDNLVTMFGLHRRWRGASVGHLALFEMTSVGPMARYAAALRRLGIGSAARQFYDVHVDIDALHEHVQEDMVAGLVEQDPGISGEVLFGARALVEIERRFAQALLEAWSADRTSLVAPLPAERAA
jgi:Iron-containing redox enzyme